MALRLDACIAQHQGDRTEQQDRVALMAHPRITGMVIAVVADGMGGHTGGALAAEQVIHTVNTNFQQSSFEDDPHELLDESLREAHTMIKASRFINEKDPHSTAVVLLILPGNQAVWAHCGDSRLYYFRHRYLRTRTVDHSYVEHLIRSKRISQADAEKHPNKNILLTSLGGRDDPKIEFANATAIEGDSFILCSDGLWAYFEEEELGELITSGSAREVAARLIELARERGAGEGDNISLALLKFVADPDAEPPAKTYRYLTNS